MSSESGNDDRKPSASSNKKWRNQNLWNKKLGPVRRIKKIYEKKLVWHEQAWDEYCKFINANLEKQKNYTESPHIVIRRSLYLIEDNSIILRSPTIPDDTSFHRKIYYEIEKLGKNIKIHSKNKKYKNVKIDDIIGGKIFILVNLKLVWKIKGKFFWWFWKAHGNSGCWKTGKSFCDGCNGFNCFKKQINKQKENINKWKWSEFSHKIVAESNQERLFFPFWHYW